MCFKACSFGFNLPESLGSQWEANRELLSRHQLLTLDPEKAFTRSFFEELISYCSAKQIRSLNIEHAKLTDKDISLLGKISTLEKLRLGPHCQIQDEGLSHLAKLPLQALSIARASSITIKGFKQLSKMPLQQLTLGVKSLTPDQLTELFKLKLLTALDLGVFSGVSIQKAKSQFSRLQYFNGRKIEGDKRLGLENLPTVLLIKVLNYLEHPQADTCLRRTCNYLMKGLPLPSQVNLCFGGQTRFTTLLEKYPKESICTIKAHCRVTGLSPSITALLQLPALRKLSIRGFFLSDYKKNLAIQSPLEELYLDEAKPLSTHGFVSWLWLEQLTKLQTFSFNNNELETTSLCRLDHGMWGILKTLPLRKIKIAHLSSMLKDFKNALTHPTVKEISMGDSWDFSDRFLQGVLKSHKNGFAKLEKLALSVNKPDMSTIEALLQLPLQELRIGGLSLNGGKYSDYVKKNPQWKGVNFGTFVRKGDAIFLDKEPTYLYKMYSSPEDRHLFKHFSFMLRYKLGEEEGQLTVKPINPQPNDPAYEMSDISFVLSKSTPSAPLTSPPVSNEVVASVQEAPIAPPSVLPESTPSAPLTSPPVLSNEVVASVQKAPITSVTPSSTLAHAESETQIPPQESQSASGVLRYFSAVCHAISSLFSAIYEWFRGLWQRS